MRNLLLAVFVLACAFSAVAQNKHPFTFDDMMALKRVEEPVPSPDGKWVLFAAVDVDLKANTKTPHVWVVRLTPNQNDAGMHHPSPVLARVGAKSTTDPSTQGKDSQANPSPSLGMTSGEREIISDQ